MTLPLLIALATAQDPVRERLRELLTASIEARRSALPEVQQLLAASNAFAIARSRAETLIAEATASLAVFPDSAARQALTGLAGYVLTRTK